MFIEKRVIFIFIQIHFWAFCFGQRGQADSLEKRLPELKDSARIDCLNTLGKFFSEFQNDTAWFYAKEANREAIQLNYARGIAESSYCLGLIEWNRQTDFDAMESFFSEAIKIKERIKDTVNLGDAYVGLAYAQYAQSKFIPSIRSGEKAKIIFESVGDSLNLAMTNGLIVLSYESAGHYEKALEYCRMGLELNRKINYSEGTYNQLMNMGNLYKDAEDYESAIEYYFKAINQAVLFKNAPIRSGSRLLRLFSLSENLALFFAHQMIGEAYFQKKQYDSARHYYLLVITEINASPGDSSLKKHFLEFPLSRMGEIYLVNDDYHNAHKLLMNALQHFTGVNDRNQVMRMLFDLSKLYVCEKDLGSALKYSKSLLQIAEETGSRQYIREASKLLWKTYGQRNHDSAYYYLARYTLIKDSMEVDQSVKKLAFFKAALEDENKLSQISILQKEKKIQQQKLNRESLLKNIFFGSLFVLVLLGIVIFRNIALKRKSERLQNERTQIEFRQQTTELEMQALRAQMNPHFIFNSLNSINRFILQNNRTQASEYLTKFSRMVRMILQNSQVSQVSLECEIESLTLYLDLEALRFNHHFSYKISVPGELDVSMIKIPPLIVQPYVENAIWHGLMHKEERGQLDIEFSEESHFLFIKIADDGIGRKKAVELMSKSATRHKSLGLRITADRIAMLRGIQGTQATVIINDLVSDEGSGAGTEVIIKIPLIYV